jgi:hypothetical protein
MQYIQLGTQSNGSIPTPGSDKLNFFIGTDGIPKLKDENGVITEFSGTGSTAGVVSVTYSELYGSITGGTLTPGAFYEITDYETCYDQPDFDYFGGAITTGNYKQSGVVQPIIVLALSIDAISEDAYQPAYPFDKIKYDWQFNQTEATNSPAKGRITERIDQFGNRTDYDHRNILFKRYVNYVPEYNNQYPGTVTLNNGTLTGIGTTFTSLSVNDIIHIQNSGEYRITLITDDDEMTVTGNTYNNISGTNFYGTYQFNQGYKRNNVENPTGYTEHLTFDYINDPYTNNYIGNHANLYFDGNSFLLANNVFIGEHANNKFGDSCYNNTFNDDCTNNVVGSNFYNNTFDDDFDNNVITTSFYGNYVSANFQHNRIGYNFYQNLITTNNFYRNQIGNDFNGNRIVNNDFQNNVIGNQFNNNFIKQEFYKNVIGNGFNGNEISAFFHGNRIGNGANNNIIGLNESNNGEFRDNVIGEYFEDNDTSGNFYSNQIGNFFHNNVIEEEFAFNEIGNTFDTNAIGEYFGYGYATTRGNKIGNYFQNNVIRDHFYDNVICDGFRYNSTPIDFQFNDIKYPIDNVDFRVNNKKIDSIGFTTPNSTSDGVYPNLSGSSNLDGEGAIFEVTVSGNIVTNVTFTNPGYDYTNGEVITISSGLFNGDGSDLTITVTGVTPEAMVTGDYNCTIIKDPVGQLILTTVSTASPGLYYMTDITDVYV